MSHQTLLLALALTLCGCGGPPSEVATESYPGTQQPRYQGSHQLLESGIRVAHGQWRFWYRNGQVQATGSFQEGAPVREADLLASSTRLPRAGRSGKWTAWDSQGAPLWEGVYKAGKRRGLWTFWYPNGQVHALGEFRDGREVGRHIMWFETGRKKSEGLFTAGRKRDLHRTWDEQGTLRTEGRFEDGLASGLHRVWDENGTLREEAAFVEGLLHGDRRLYDARGKVVWSATYTLGEEAGEAVGALGDFKASSIAQGR